MNFKDVKSAEGDALGTSFLMPGMYYLTPLEAEYGESSKKGTPYMEITFKGSSENMKYNGGLVRAKFYITDKARDRIQYLHEGLYGRLISPDKTFKKESDIAEYFDTLFKAKTIKKPFVVGGSISEDGTKIYSDLPYSGFIVPEDLFEEGPFEIGSGRFQRSITSTNKVFSPSLKKKSISSNEDILPGDENEVGEAENISDDLPF